MDISTATDGLVSIIKAYDDIDIEDSLDGIISKINEVGNKFAVSNNDIVEVMTRTSSAMAAANNTFEETVALATAAIEITRDAASVGNGLKTLSMRIRGYDEETEEYSEDVVALTGTIADLTKVASNNYSGISLFEPGDPNTYRSTYDILSDIADIWDELADKSQAKLLEALFGKRQAQIGSAILSNFDQARSAIEKMEASAGSAEREMDKITQSLEYKLNALQETWVGVAQNLFQTDNMKVVVDVLTFLSGLVDGLTGDLGLFGTTALLVFGTQFVRAALNAKNAASEARIAIAGLKFDPDNLNEYVYALAGLRKKQQEAVLSTTNLSEAQKAAIMNEVAAIKDKSAVQLASILNTNEETAMNKLNISSIKELTAEKLKAALASKQITQAQYDQIVVSELLNTKNMTLAMTFKTLASNALATLTAMIKSPMAWISFATTIIMGIVQAWKNHQQVLEENRQKLMEVADAARDEAEEIKDLYDEYLKANIAYNNNIGSKDDLTSATDNLLEALGYEKTAIAELVDEYGTLEKAIDSVTKKSLEEKAGSILEGYKAAEDDALKAAHDSMGFFSGSGITIKTSGDDRKFAEFLQEAGYLGSGNLPLISTTMYTGINDYGDFDSLVEGYEKLLEIKEKLESGIGTAYTADELKNAKVYTDIATKINVIADALERVNDYTSEYNELQARLAYIDYVEDNGVPETKEQYDALEQSLLDAADASGRYLGSSDQIKSVILDTLATIPDLQDLLETTAETAYSAIIENSTALSEALGDTTTDVEKLKAVIDAISSGNFNSLTADNFSDLISIIPELKTELAAYYNAVEAGNDPIEEQTKLLNVLRDAAEDFTQSGISDALSDAASAADEFGPESYQAQTAMRVLAQYAPQVAAALYDEETGMYNLGDASEYTASTILAFAKINLTSSINKMKDKLAELEAEFQTVTKASARFMVLSKMNDLGLDLDQAMSELEDLNKIDLNISSGSSTSSSGGGGSTTTPADTIKEKFDALNASIEHSIFLQQQYYAQAEGSLDSTAMRSALIRQIGYYKQIQTEAHKAADELRAYYRSQGMSDAAIEAQSDIQELSETWWDAAESIKNASTQMAEDIVAAFSDAVDAIQDVYDTLHEAADEYAESGFITVDTLQEIISMGPQYLAFLQDENGQLVINEERIRALIAARTQQMAVESALAYVEALRAAKNSQNVEELNNLLHATQATTDATWGLVYASLGLAGLSDDQYQAALNNINALRALADSAITSIGNTTASVTDSLTEMQNGVNDILEYVMDMIEQKIEDQTDAIEAQKDAYSELIDMKKASLEASKEESEYTEEVASKVQEIAKLQAQIDALSLDNSREAQAQKAALLEEMAELQKELSDYQADYAYDAQVDALDEMEDAYTKEKDQEIEVLEESISSYQKLYGQAIHYIRDNWETLYDDLIAWNTEAGSVLNDEITSAWENCLAAAQKYGDYVTALKALPGDIDAAGSGSNTIVGSTNYDSSYNNEDMIRAIVNRMKINSADWFSANAQGQTALANENKALAAQLSQYGINAVLDKGVWYIDRVGGKKLYDVYHQGGIVGGGTTKDNERLALLKDNEWVLSDTMVSNLMKQMDIIAKLDDVASRIMGSLDNPFYSGISKLIESGRSAASRVLNDNRDSRRIEINIGDTYISGANHETVKKHEQITKGWMDELARQLGAKW